MDLSVVIPVYNAAGRLPALLERIEAVLGRMGLSYEVVFVDDGSRDDSWKVLRQLHASRPARVVAVQLMRNYGQHNALMAGFRRSRGRLVVCMDDDMQHPPEEIPKLVQAIEAEGLDLVYGVPEGREYSPWRNAGSYLVTAFYRIIFRTSLRIGSFKIIRRELLQSIFSYTLNFTFIDGLLAWNTQRIGQVPVSHHPRSDGRSGYSLGKLVVLALNLFTNFSLIPLQLVSACGFIAAGGGVLLALYYLVQALRQRIEVPGYASLIVAVLVLGGVQLLALGIIGEYLGRLHLNVNRKPQYVERQALEATPESPEAARDGEQARAPDSSTPRA